MKTFNEFVNESKKSDQLAAEINRVMIPIDDSMSYQDFAAAVAKVLIEEYGDHNYKPFLDELKKLLK